MYLACKLDAKSNSATWFLSEARRGFLVVRGGSDGDAFHPGEQDHQACEQQLLSLAAREKEKPYLLAKTQHMQMIN